ncbi:MAG: MMPL family transporter [Natrialbaceae archaeon]|nr:MMPL family transporter [Natrialbaceae archaeon]
MESFFPDAERIELYQNLPEIVRPADYTFITVVEHLEEDFETGWIGSVTVYIEDDQVNSAAALADVNRALTDPPEALESEDRRAEASSIFDPMNNLASRDQEFAALLNRSDTTGNGVPNRNVDLIFDYMLNHGVGERYLSPTRTDTRIIFDLHVDTAGSDATAAAQTVADDMRLHATPTGQIVVDQVVIELITDSALRSLVVAFILTAIFLMATFRLLEGKAVYGIVNILPVIVVVGLLAGSMRFFDVPFSPFNAPILAVSIGLGVDYSVHFMHRFVDEFDGENINEALLVTIRGTGGALSGSMLTTMCGLGVLYLAVIPLIMEFGLLLALGVFYAYAASVLILPSTIVVWYRLDRRLAPHRPFLG